MFFLLLLQYESESPHWWLWAITMVIPFLKFLLIPFSHSWWVSFPWCLPTQHGVDNHQRTKVFKISHFSTGCPKKYASFVHFWVFDLGRDVIRGKKIILRTLGTKKIWGCLVKFWVHGPCFIENLPIVWSFYDF